MIYGKRDVVVEIDQKPLENLHMKPIHSAPMRIQRMMLKLQPYTYTVKYVKGAQLGLADCLSRLSQPADPKIQAESEKSFMVCSVETLSDSNHQRIATATAKDSELQAVRQLIIDGWPDQRQELIKKAQQDGQDVYLALLELRNTPRDQVLGSPV